MKEKFKNTILNDFNQEENLKIIKNKINERGDNMNKYFKYAFIPVCLVIITICGITLKNMFHDSNVHIITNGNNTIKINKVKENNQNSLDADINVIVRSDTALKKDGKIQVVDELNEYQFYKELVIPSDFNAQQIYAIYTKKDLKSDQYDILNNYVIELKVKKANTRYKGITIAFSKENKPLRDYYFSSETDQTSIINDHELLIYNYESAYMVTFEYDGINFDIETTGISQNELLELLKSIIK